MRLLVCLAEHAGQVVSIDELLNQVWTDVTVSPDSVYQAVTSLRRLLGDDPKQPQYIATVPRLGYRMVAQVGPWVEEPFDMASRQGQADQPPLARAPAYVSGTRPLLIALAVACLAALTVLGLNTNLTARHPASTTNAAPPKSVAVLAFLDLTSQAMAEEYFADGITEELTDKLSKISDLHVAPPTASFYFKGKRATVADIARSLGVAYILDGSVRKSGTMLRISARLVRASDGYVAWSETYDRPEGDRLWVQEDIANEVARSLGAAIH